MVTFAISEPEHKDIFASIVSPPPFSLEDAGSAWYVLLGKLDIFLVSTKNGMPVGARHHVMPVEEGQAAFGVGSDVPDVTLIAAKPPAPRGPSLSCWTSGSQTWATHCQTTIPRARL
jgi:hypothetical protein